MTAPGARWLERAIVFAGGFAVAWLVIPRDSTPESEPPLTAAPPVRAPLPGVPTDNAPPAAAPPRAVVDGTTAEAATTGAPSATTAGSTGDGVEPSTTAEPPEFPLRAMPGMRTLRRAAKRDETNGSWVLNRATEVPAKTAQVEAFYDGALRGLGLTVQRIPEPPAADGTLRVTLRARGRGQHVTVSIRQPPDQLRTRARILWRIFDR